MHAAWLRMTGCRVLASQLERVASGMAVGWIRVPRLIRLRFWKPKHHLGRMACLNMWTVPAYDTEDIAGPAELLSTASH